MAKYTENYNLKKTDYTDQADIPGDFNGNMDIIDAEMKRQDEETKSHKADLTSRGYLSHNYVGDFNDAILSGKYSGYDALNSPLSGSTFLLNATNDGSSGLVSQIATVAFGLPQNIGNSYTRVKKQDGTWTLWQKIVIPETVDMSGSLLNGWELTYNEKLIISISGNLVIISGIINNGSRVDNTVLFNLPQEFIPRFNQTKMLSGFTGALNENISRVFIASNGDVLLFGCVDTTANLVLDISFII